MLTKAQIKYIRSLTQHKFRQEHGVFVVEGVKIADEWLATTNKIDMIVATKDWLDANIKQIGRHTEAGVYEVEESILASISSLQTPNKVLLVVPFPMVRETVVGNEWYIALEDIQDPGNMGTIIRIADWFGVKSVFCSKGCVDKYNPKVIQSAMGGHLRVDVFETDLVEFLQGLSIPVIGATLGGENVYNTKKTQAGVLVIGNESKGISDEVLKVVNLQVMIPRKGGAESLNAGVSAGILCALLMGSNV